MIRSQGSYIVVLPLIGPPSVVVGPDVSANGDYDPDVGVGRHEGGDHELEEEGEHSE